MKMITLLLLMCIFSLLLVMTTSSQSSEGQGEVAKERKVVKTEYTPTSMIEEYSDGTGNAIIYSGMRYADSNGTMLENAKSLKNCEFCDDIKMNIDLDPKFNVQVNDYNYTSIDVCVMATESGRYPLLTYNKNNNNKVVHTYEYNVQKPSVNVWKCYNLTIPEEMQENIFTTVMKWGSNSTTIILQHEGDQVDDAYIVDGTASNYGTWDQMIIAGSTGSYYWAYLKFNITSIPVGSNIDYAALILKSYFGYQDNVVVHSTSEFNEHTITGQNEPAAGTLQDTIAACDGNSGQVCMWNVTNAVSTAYSGNTGNVSLRVYDPDDGLLYFGSKEHATSSYHPMLNVTYTFEGILNITSPLTSNTKSVSGGEKINATFNYQVNGVNITSGVTLINVTVGGEVCNMFSSSQTLRAGYSTTDNTATNFSSGSYWKTNASGVNGNGSVVLNNTYLSLKGCDGCGLITAGIVNYSSIGNYTSRIITTPTTATIFDQLIYTAVLPNSSDVVDIVQDNGANMAAMFWRNGTFTVDNSQTTMQAPAFTALQRYIIPPAFKYDDIMCVADDDDATDGLYLFMNNGSILSTRNVTTYLKDFTFIDNKTVWTTTVKKFNATMVVGCLIDTTATDTAIFLNNGSYLINNADELPPIAFASVKSYAIPPQYKYTDIIGVDGDDGANDFGIFFKNKTMLINDTATQYDSQFKATDVWIQSPSTVSNNGLNLSTSTNITLFTRISNDSSTWTRWSEYSHNDNSKNIVNYTINTSQNVGKYIQYKAILKTPDKFITPKLENVTINYTGFVLTSVPEFSYSAGVGWVVNFTAPVGLTGLQDLFINASYSGIVVNDTEPDCINYGGAADTCTYLGTGDWGVLSTDQCVITTETAGEAGRCFTITGEGGSFTANALIKGFSCYTFLTTNSRITFNNGFKSGT